MLDFIRFITFAPARRPNSPLARAFCMATMLSAATTLLASCGGGGGQAGGAIPEGAPAQPSQHSVAVDLRQYMAAVLAVAKPPSGTMLCGHAAWTECLTSVKDSAGEAEIIYDSSNGVIDYVAISSYAHAPIYGNSSPQYIGVIRNRPGPGNPTRCFSTPGAGCASPPNSSFMPEGVPYLIPDMPVVKVEALTAASNPADGSPDAPITGSVVTTPDADDDNYWPFGVQEMTGSCAQGYGGSATSLARVVYVKDVPFGGTLGTRDAVVIDGFSQSASPSTNILERYFYVRGKGRVREGIGTYDSNDGLYDDEPHYNVVHNFEQPLDTSKINLGPPECPEGSAIPLWPSSDKR